MSEQPEIHPILQQASRYAHSAVELDNQGSHADALSFYQKAVDCLEAALREPSIAQDSAPIRQCIASYQSRITTLQQVIQATSAATAASAPKASVTLPQAPGAPASSSQEPQVVTAPLPGTVATQQPEDPSVVDVGITAVKEANKKGGKYLVQGYNAATEFNEKHQVTTRVYEGMKKAYENTLALDEKYQISTKIREGTQTAVDNAKRINEEHQITTKAATIASATVRKVGELDREYKVTETIGKGIMSGINYLASKSAEYLEKHPEQSATPVSGSSSSSVPKQ